MRYLLTVAFLAIPAAGVALFLWQPQIIIYVVPTIVVVIAAWEVAGLMLNER